MSHPGLRKAAWILLATGLVFGALAVAGWNLPMPESKDWQYPVSAAYAVGGTYLIAMALAIWILLRTNRSGPST